MNRAYWENLAHNYEEQIFSVLKRDEHGLIATVIERHRSPDRTAADLGCGPGQITGLLAESFGHVHACDISSALLDQARATCADHDNISYHRLDLTTETTSPIPPVDFVLCVNVILAADLETREQLWTHITSLVAPGGTLLLVLPSHESALYTNFRRLDWHVRSGLGADEAIRHSFAREGNVPQLEHGVRGIEGVKTKHYLREEIIVQLQDRSLIVDQVEKLTYDWSIEFAEPPDWLGSPHPWNWLVVAQRPV
ncbi:class I SAM-dependent methyltransferase [Synoicihabitans lomoniglobus]|uniref:Methyltransferase domain-containing protein n=1 Tax=Synoicihabitans lomoniglobus TaxID=2909285 RepID=A0AAE9ZSM4_9BACT|nr:methyltransferase domain-containing protein [Opitutaceae bacterium LMO-M01]WED64485.1 methyltransferase domain-containing protein [Opitutaceae bacterium LMO-M01]